MFIFTGPIATWRTRKADKEENEEVEVSRRQLKNCTSCGEFLLSRHLHPAKGVTAICICSKKRKGKKGQS